MSISNSELYKMQAQIDDALSFVRQFPELADEYSTHISVEAHACRIFLHDPATAGHYLGTEGWTKQSCGSFISWTRPFNSLQIFIVNAEQIPDVTNQPVLPTEFPLLLKN